MVSLIWIKFCYFYPLSSGGYTGLTEITIYNVQHRAPIHDYITLATISFVLLKIYLTDGYYDLHECINQKRQAFVTLKYSLKLKCDTLPLWKQWTIEY